MNDTLEKTDEFLDIDFGKSGGDGDYETVPKGMYDLVIIDLSSRKKSEPKRRSDLALKQREKPTAVLEDIDEYQWIWTYRIEGGEYEGMTLTDKTTRSFGERSNAGKIAAAALGMKKYDKVLAMEHARLAGVTGSKVLLGKRVTAFVTEDEDAQGRMWNNIKEYSIYEPPAARVRRPQAASTATQSNGNGPSYPEPERRLDWDDIEPEPVKA